jgi:hypothetical protein
MGGIFMLRCFIVIFMLIPATLMAWGFHDAMGNGSPVVCVTSKSSSLGGLWAMPSSEAASIFLNPAELSMLDGTRINLSGAIIQWKTYLKGQLDYDLSNSGHTGAGTVAIGTRVSETISIGAGLTRVSDFGCNGIRDILEETGAGAFQIQAVNLLDAQGSLWEANTGLSIVANDWLTFGVSGGIRFGSGSWTLRHDIVDPVAVDDTTYGDWEESDFCFHAGVLMPLSFGTFGISGTNATDRYRSRIAVGFQKDIEILHGSTLGFEFDLQSIEEKNPAVSGRVFANLKEMIPYVRSSYSIGFIRASDYQRAALCLSTGARVTLGESTYLDLGISWRSRARAGFAFPEPMVDSVDDSGSYYSAGLSFKL